MKMEINTYPNGDGTYGVEAFRLEKGRVTALGSLTIGKSRSKVRGERVWSPVRLEVESEYRRTGVATALYEGAAQLVCNKLHGSFASTQRDRDAHSLDFWLKQVRKGRAQRVRRPRHYSKARGFDREHAPDMYDAFVLDCDQAGDLSELSLRSSLPWLAGAGAVALLALSSGKGSGGGSALVATIQAWRQPPSDIRRALQTAASKYGVPMSIMIGVAHTESRYDPKAGSRVGAQGLMQLMPRTAANLGVQDPWDAQQNAFGGAKFLAALKRQYGSWDKALAAYNWGQGNVTRNPTPGQWPQATRNYVGNVLKISAEA